MLCLRYRPSQPNVRSTIQRLGSTTNPLTLAGLSTVCSNTLATALIDRLMHYGEAIIIKGDSYRMNDKDPEPDPPSA